MQQQKDFLSLSLFPRCGKVVKRDQTTVVLGKTISNNGELCGVYSGTGAKNRYLHPHPRPCNSLSKKIRNYDPFRYGNGKTSDSKNA